MSSHLLDWLENCRQTLGDDFFSHSDTCFEQLPKAQQLQFSEQFLDAISTLDTPAVWAVGSLVFGQPLGDDSFKDFRRWLVFQGRVAVTRAINTPDDFASTLDFKARDGQIFLEAVDWLEEPASKVASGTRSSSLGWITPESDGLRTLVPKTYDAFAPFYNPISTAADDADHLLIEGLGRLDIGNQVRHRGHFGVGIVRKIHLPETGIVDIEFAGGVRTMRITSAFFDRADE